MNKKYTLNDLKPFLPKECEIIGASLESKYLIKDIKTIGDATEDSLVFVDHKRNDKQELAEVTKGKIIICDKEVQVSEKLASTILIQVAHPKLVFSLIGNALFVRRPSFGIHPSAIIHETASITKEVYVGPNAFIGPNCVVGKGSYIYGNTYLYQNVIVGEHVMIQAGAVLGADGYGYNRKLDGFPVQFPHVGRIVLEDYVDIGSNTSIDLGALGDTHIGKGSKIDNLIHLGHNVRIGEYVYVAAQTTIGGSSKISDYAEIWMGASIADGTYIGKRASVGIGSVVIKDVAEDTSVFGNPARKFRQK
jgi:UDP-3-O-[3-hydroxymyristoyl] glucosamine N-acyltransferase